jgi:hypothetical protein
MFTNMENICSLSEEVTEISMLNPVHVVALVDQFGPSWENIPSLK